MLTPGVSVLAYNNYTVSVQAFTGAGGGETVNTVVLSPQAGMYQLVQWKSSKDSQKSIHICNYADTLYLDPCF